MNAKESLEHSPCCSNLCEEHKSIGSLYANGPEESNLNERIIQVANKALNSSHSPHELDLSQPCLDFCCHQRAGMLPFSEPSSTVMECLLRMMKLNYRIVQRLKSMESSHVIINKKSYYGTLSVVEIIKTLSGVHFNEDLSPREAAILRLTTATLECQTQSCLMHHRWVDQNREWRQTSEDFKGLNVFRNLFLESKVHRRIRTRLEAVGLGLVTSDKVLCVLVRDLQALSVLLGDKTYIFGNKPSSLDCVCFGIVSNLMYCTVETNLVNIIKTNFSNLFDHCERIKLLYWPDWDRVVHKNRSCDTPRYFFSFRLPKGKQDSKIVSKPRLCRKCTKPCENQPQTCFGTQEKGLKIGKRLCQSSTSINKQEIPLKKSVSKQSVEDKVPIKTICQKCSAIEAKTNSEEKIAG